MTSAMTRIKCLSSVTIASGLKAPRHSRKSTTSVKYSQHSASWCFFSWSHTLYLQAKVLFPILSWCCWSPQAQRRLPDPSVPTLLARSTRNFVAMSLICWSLDVIRHIKHNQEVLVSFCVNFNPLPSISMFKDNKTLGWEVPSLKTLFSTRVTYKHKLDKGIISSWEVYAKNHVSTNWNVELICTNWANEVVVRINTYLFRLFVISGMLGDSPLGNPPVC
jgi:hypothetical protein